MIDSFRVAVPMLGNLETGHRDGNPCGNLVETPCAHMETHWKPDGNCRFPAWSLMLNLLLAASARLGYSPRMSVATLQQFGQSLPSWLALVQRGETVAIVDGGREVARLVPPDAAHARAAPVTATVQWPDFAARRRAVFGDVVLPAGTAQALVDEDRGA